MKYIKQLFVGSLLLGTSSIAFADLKIGVVDVRAVLEKAPQTAVINAQLNKQFKGRQQDIYTAKKMLDDNTTKLNKEAAVMKADERSALQDKVNSERANLQGMIASFQQDFANAQNQAMQDLMTKVNKAMSKLADDQHYDLILQRDATPYYNSKYDLTNEAVQAMNKLK